jgi:outer membrane protein assembly factor BamB
VVRIADETPDGEVIETVAAGSSNTSTLFRYDASSGQYIYNLDTTGFPVGSFVVRAILDDGTTHEGRFALR